MIYKKSMWNLFQCNRKTRELHAEYNNFKDFKIYYDFNSWLELLNQSISVPTEINIDTIKIKIL